MANDTASQTTPSAVAWRQGAALAFRMLREIEAVSLDDTAYESEFREGRPQLNIAAEYLSRMRDLLPAAQAAFGAILTDYIATGMDGSEPNLDVTEQEYMVPIATSGWRTQEEPAE